MYELSFTPRINEINVRGTMQFPAIINYFQHIAYKHASELGVGHEQLFPQGLTWLLLRYTVEVTRYPTLEEEIKVVTWVAESDNPRYTLREFELKDSKQNVICKATTSWVLFNFRKRKPVNFKEFWPEFKAENKRAIKDSFQKLSLPAKVNNTKIMKVNLHDLDINQHVNHRVNIEWIIEGMPEKVLKKYELAKLEISYKEQAFLDEEIITETEIIKEKEFVKAIHQINKTKKKKLVSKAVTYWRTYDN
jgi:medium-chain acyl-[acyl-carrier-protein] hydrolase